jgi:hypothetical protein
LQKEGAGLRNLLEVVCGSCLGEDGDGEQVRYGEHGGRQHES